MNTENKTEHDVSRFLLNDGLAVTLLHPGDLVHYQPKHYVDAEWENGIVKEVRDEVNDSVWVVYNCAGRWDKYMDYTSAKTRVCDLKLGWRN